MESEAGSIPSAWEHLFFSEIITESKERVGDRKIPEYSITNTGIHPREVTFNKALSKTTEKNKVMKKGQLGFGMSREILNWGVFSDEIGCVSPAYRVYDVRNDIPSFYLEGYIKFRAPYFLSLIKGSSREGQSLDVSSLMSKEFHLPSLSELNDYEELAKPLEERIAKIEEESLALGRIRDALLPKLMSGEIDVGSVQLDL